jgi:hypothetical protein
MCKNILSPRTKPRRPIARINDDVSVYQNHSSRVSARSFSQLIAGLNFQLRTALRACAFVGLFCRVGRRYTRLRRIPPPVFSQANTSPGAAPGITILFFASAVNVICGIIPHAGRAVKARERLCQTSNLWSGVSQNGAGGRRATKTGRPSEREARESNALQNYSSSAICTAFKAAPLSS